MADDTMPRTPKVDVPLDSLFREPRSRIRFVGIPSPTQRLEKVLRLNFNQILAEKKAFVQELRARVPQYKAMIAGEFPAQWLQLFEMPFPLSSANFELMELTCKPLLLRASLALSFNWRSLKSDCSLLLSTNTAHRRFPFHRNYLERAWYFVDSNFLCLVDHIEYKSWGAAQFSLLPVQLAPWSAAFGLRYLTHETCRKVKALPSAPKVDIALVGCEGVCSLRGFWLGFQWDHLLWSDIAMPLKGSELKIDEGESGHDLKRPRSPHLSDRLAVSN